jgi:hypothetical protein
MKIYGGMDVMDPDYLDFSTQLYAMAALQMRKEPLDPTRYKAGWAPEPV